MHRLLCSLAAQHAKGSHINKRTDDRANSRGGTFGESEGRMEKPEKPLKPALERQEGGGHYKAMAIQPFEYIHKNGIGFAEGCVIKYVSRWKTKGGVEDLRKARHFLDLLIEEESA